MMFRATCLFFLLSSAVFAADPKVVAVFDAPATAVTGLALGKKENANVLWAVSYTTKKIYQLDPDNGTVNFSFSYAPQPDFDPAYHRIGPLACANDTLFLPMWETEQSPYFGIYMYSIKGVPIKRVWNVIC